MQASRPAHVKFTHHANKRIRKRGLNHRAILRLMWTLPYAEGTHRWESPDRLLVIFVDEMRVRKVVTAYLRHAN